MKSPKFPFKKGDIEQVVNVSRLKSRWREKVRDAMRTQPVPDPVEHLDFHIAIDGHCTAIASDVCSGTYTPQVPIRLLAEKSKGLCRQLVIPAVKDALILQTLSDALWEEVKTKAPSNKAFYAPNDHRFSKQIRGMSDDYGPISVWMKFQEKILDFTKQYKFVVVTDIANYYDSISYDHLRNIVSDLSIAREHSLDLLIYILSHMLWQPDYMPRVQIGLPQMNLDAARLLAHCFLFDIDKLLSSNKQIDFTRFMDDIDIGVDSRASAKKVLRDLDLSLQTRQVRLNSGKTKIFTHKEAENHFCVKENKILDLFQAHIEIRRNNLLSIKMSRKLISSRLTYGLRNGVFINGNGEKILKRSINYAKDYMAEIEYSDFRNILLNFPSARQAALQWWQHCEKPIHTVDAIVDFVASGEMVDDFSLISVATALVNARLPANSKTLDAIGNICSHTDIQEKWGLYAALWLYSKYGTEFELFRLIERYRDLWATNELLTRLVAGLYPRMNGTASFVGFDAIIRRVPNPWAASVFDFHESLATKVSGYTAVAKFIEAQNPSQPNRISHSKFLMLLSLLRNREIAPTAITRLKTSHKYAFTDDYYFLLGEGAKQSAPSGRTPPFAQEESKLTVITT